MKRNEALIRSAFLGNLLPMILSVLGGTVNTLVDSVFVSNTEGPNGLSAVNLCIPIFLLMCACGALLSGGAAVLSARASGLDDMKGAEVHYQRGLFLALTISSAIMVLGCALSGPISVFLSKGGELQPMVYTYAFWSFAAAIPNCMMYFPIEYLNLEGKKKDITAMMVIMVGLDLAFDALFLLVFHWGMFGAALASLLSVTAETVYGFWRLQRGFTNYHFKLKKPDWAATWQICAAGSPFALGNLLDSVKLILINAMLISMGGTVLAVFAVLNSLSEILISVTYGVPAAAGPMLGFFYAAKDNHGVRMLMRLELIVGTILSTAVAVGMVVLSPVIEWMFSSSEALLLPLICLGVFGIFDMIVSIYSVYLSKIGKLFLANASVIQRRFISAVVTLFVISQLAGYVWLFLPVSALLTFVAMLIIVPIYLWREEDSSASGLFLLDESLEQNNRILDFSVDLVDENICDAAQQLTDSCVENGMSPKLTMRIQLALEEILTVYVRKNTEVCSVDLRVYVQEGEAGIRIRCGGVQYNPFSELNEDSADFLMGVTLIRKIAKIANYTYALGLNNILISFDLTPAADPIDKLRGEK